MKILVVSDTHGDLEKVFRVYEKLALDGPVDMIVHCGDYYRDALDLKARLGISVAAVKGNCDGAFSDDEFSLLETEAGNFLVTHGHMNNVDYGMENIYYKALENGCIGAIFGHTHRSAYTKAGDVYLMNPGSLSRPRDGSSGTFGLLVTGESGLWGKIYDYDDFMLSEANHEMDRMGGKIENGENIQIGTSASSKKTQVRGGHLRDLLNYSDRF